MKKEYAINGCPPVSVELKLKVVRIFNGEALHCLMKEDVHTRTMDLVQAIKEDYEGLFHKPLKISNDSLVIEIWMHVYAERLSHAIAKFMKWKLIWKFHHFVKGRCEVIDCGLASVDHDRWLWDLLGKLKKPLFTLFKRLP